MDARDIFLHQLGRPAAMLLTFGRRVSKRGMEVIWIVEPTSNIT